MSDFEQQWAVALQKAKALVGASGKDLNLERKQVEEEMAYFKNKIMDLAQQKNLLEVQKTFSTLITLRAKQMVILFREYEKTYGKIDENMSRRETEKCLKDCIQLAILVDKLMGIEHDL